MKATKRILAILMCVFLMFTTLSVTVSAEATGSITIQNSSTSNAGVGGKTLNLFKIFDAATDGTNISYQWNMDATDADGNSIYYGFFFGPEGKVEANKENGSIHDVVAYLTDLNNDSFTYSQMAADLHDYIHTNSIAPTQTSGEINASATSYTFSGLELGYYMIYDATDLSGDDVAAVRSAAMLTTSGDNVVITLKADRPKVEKTVDDNDDPAVDDWKKGTTSAIGDVVTFKITSAVPNHDHYGDDYHFVIYDSMADGLQLDEDSITVTIGGNAVTDGITINTDNATLAEGDDFSVSFNNIPAYTNGTSIEITYIAKVLESASPQNLNTATLEYSNDPLEATSRGTTESSASVYTYQTVLTKHAESINGDPSQLRLAGAQFELYKVIDGNEVLMQFRKETDSSIRGIAPFIKYIYAPEADLSEDTVTTVLDTVNTGESESLLSMSDGGHLGEIKIIGLSEGDYVLKEVKAPDGYQVAKDPFTFTIADTIGTLGNVGNATITTSSAQTTGGQFTNVAADASTLRLWLGVTNRPGAALPETGGMGTTFITIMGIILVAGALTFFIVRKRSKVK